MILKVSYTLFFDGPIIPGGSCSLSDQVTPLSYDRFMHPLHLDFIKPAVSIGQKDVLVGPVRFHISTWWNIKESSNNLTICSSTFEQESSNQKSKNSTLFLILIPSLQPKGRHHKFKKKNNFLPKQGANNRKHEVYYCTVSRND